MKLGDSKAIKTGQWLVNEIFLDSDINFVGEATYQNLTDQMALQFITQLELGDDVVMDGLQLIYDAVLTADLKTGMAVSPRGTYIDSDTWGFIADPGALFSAIVPVDQSVTFDAGGTNTRIDVVEIRPVELPYKALNRNFKDPVTGIVGSAVVNVRKEFGVEVHILKGDDTTALTNEQTTFTVNSATIGSDIAGKYILFSTIYADYYVWYNTGSSGNPAVSGRTGIEISVNAGDDKDAIGAATRAGITVSGVTVSGSLAQAILTGTTYANLTNATNGDTGAYFDTISITQGNGATARTAGWVKVAEVEVASGAGSIDQNDIKDWRDSDTWDNNTEQTVIASFKDHDQLINFVDNEHRLITLSTSSASGGTDGDVWFKYTP